MYEYKTQLISEWSDDEVGITGKINEEAKDGWRVIDMQQVHSREVTMLSQEGGLKFLKSNEVYGILKSAIITFERKIDKQKII